MATISLQGDVANRLNGGMNVGSAIELPFFVPRFWALNGDARLAAVGGAQYFGGWAVSAEDWQKALYEEWQLQGEIGGFAHTQIVSADQRTVDAYATRALLVAPICNRTTWFTQDGNRFSEYAPGTRQHVQAIAFMAIADQNTMPMPLGPVMLTAKGFQAKNLLDSFAAWDRSTRQLRGKVAPGVPAWCFYLSIGTFKQQREAVMVGKQGRQSPITPLSAYVPKEITSELIEKLFVGQDVAEQMAYCLEQSQDWLHAYDSKRAGAGPDVTAPADDFPLEPVNNHGMDEPPF